MLAPEPRPYGVSDTEAVELCRNWMIFLGASDSTIASGPAATLCQIFSTRYLAWVSNARGNIDASLVRLAGAVAGRDGRQPLIFIRGGFFVEARKEAEASGVALLRFRATDADLSGANLIGRRIIKSGLLAL
jgi:hypothetical protein